MNYKVILDIYTLADKEFEEEYNKATTSQRVAMNIDKFMGILNAKDYNKAYNLLDETFRSKNFNNVESFKKYVKENFFEYNNIQYKSMKTEGYIYIYSVQLTNKMKQTENKNMTIIMQLKEGTDFVMSFSFE